MTLKVPRLHQKKTLKSLYDMLDTAHAGYDALLANIKTWTDHLLQATLIANTVQTFVWQGPGGTITSFSSKVTTAITTGGTLTLAINGVNVTTGVLTVANGALVNSIVTAIPTAARTVAPGDVITITPAGFATAGSLTATVTVT